jgi:hypothetical protein
VIHFSSGVSYMDSAPSLLDLFQPYDFWARDFSFSIHGNLLNTPSRIEGRFAKQTPAQAC